MKQEQFSNNYISKCTSFYIPDSHRFDCLSEGISERPYHYITMLRINERRNKVISVKETFHERYQE